MTIKIRKATPDDFPAVLELIRQLAVFEKAPEKVTNTVEQMEQEQDYFQCLVAENNEGKIVAMAIYFFAYYSWVGKSLYLDDLYVTESCRGQKIGTQLLDALFEVARNENCKRVRWQVLDWNTPAIKMYEKLGADIDTNWYNCDFDEEQIKNMKF